MQPAVPRLAALAEQIKASHSPAELAQISRLIAPAPASLLMSPADFELLLTGLRGGNGRRGFSAKSTEAARLVLVMGASINEAAAETGQTRQSVNQLMLRLQQRIAAVPPGWVKYERWLPPDIAQELEQVATSLMAAETAPQT